jgi:hypothetical protein
MFRGWAQVGGGTSAASGFTSTKSRTAAVSPFFRVRSISSGAPPKAARFRRCVASFHFESGSGVNMFIKPLNKTKVAVCGLLQSLAHTPTLAHSAGMNPRFDHEKLMVSSEYFSRTEQEEEKEQEQDLG